MLKKAVKSILTVLLCAAVVLSASTAAFAAGRRAVNITRGGVKLDISPVLLQDGRTYAPYDELFGALGAEAVRDEATGTITATSGDTEIVIEPDDYYILVTVDGTTQWVYTGAPTITDTSGDMVFVPVRYVAQALGYVVGWDDATRAIELMSVEELIDASGATYTVMDKYLAFVGEFNNKCHRVDGSFQAEINMDYILGYYGDDALGALTMSGTATGLIDPGGEDMSLNLKTNLSDYLLDGIDTEELDDQTLAMLEQLEDLDFSIIVNNEDGVTYIRSPLLSALAGVQEDTWISMETGEATSLSEAFTVTDIQVTSVMDTGQMLAEGESFKQYVTAILKSVLLEDTGYDTAETLEQLNGMFSDQAMVRDGDDYIVRMTSNYSDYDYEDSYTVELRFSFDADEFTGIAVSYISSTSYSYWDDYTYSSSTEFSYSFSSDGRSTLTLTAAEDDVTILSFDMTFDYTETDEVPAREPDAGSTVVSLDDIVILESVVEPEEII